MSKKILIVEARFYEDMADALAEGAIAALEEAGCSHERVSVPGVLEVPVAIKYAAETGAYDGYVALGVVIRGETSHYDIVCGESARVA
jgi:6,7-dimethyl-8-ribityllumazine synthase